MRPGRTIPFLHAARPARRGAALAMIAALAAGAFCAGASAKDLLTVRMDKAKLVKYPSETETIIVGNPIIADVTMIKSSGMLVVTGKGYGETNLILLDKEGTILTNVTLRVTPAEDVVTVQRGTDRETYACQPRCEPTVSVGDAAAFLGNSAAAIKQRNEAAMPAPAPGAGGTGTGTPQMPQMPQR